MSTGETANAGRTDSGLYAALMAHYLHQDRLMWGGVQFIIAVQAAVLAGGFVQRSNWAGWALMLLGVVLTLVILGFIKKSMNDRDVNLTVMDKLVNYLLPGDVTQETKPNEAGRYVSLTSEPPRYIPLTFWKKRKRYLLVLRGRNLLYFTFGLFIAIDLALAIFYSVTK